MNFADIAKRFRIDQPEQFRIADANPDETLGLTKDHATDLLKDGVKRLKDLQERLYAGDRWSILIVLQAMDAAGKDGVIEHVMSGLNPQGCEVHAFKQPTEEELSHDFLWRAAKSVPQHRHLQPFALRGSPGGARPSGIPRPAETSSESVWR